MRATRIEFELDCICQSIVLAESPKIEYSNHELKVVAYSLEFKVGAREVHNARGMGLPAWAPYRSYTGTLL